MYIAANQGDRDPYWTEPWPSAVCAAQELFSNPTLLSLHPSSSSQQNTTTTTTTICELGCGLGLLGIVAALSGPYNVTLLDREPLALHCCLINAEINGVGTSLAAQGISSSSILQHLTAKERSKIAQHMAINNNNNNKNQPTARVGLIDVDILDWSAPVTPRHQGTYDILLLSDVLYEKYSVEPVASIVPILLKGNDGSDGLALLLADPPNRARMNRERFLELLQNGGNGDEFVLSGVEEKVVMFEGEEKEVMLITIKRMSRFGDTIGVKRF